MATSGARKSRSAQAKRGARRNEPPARKRKLTAPKRKVGPRKRAAGGANAAAAGILVVNIIPNSLSFEDNQDSEPMLAVNPLNPDQIVATAFTPDPMGSGFGPYFVSSDGGR